MTIKLLLPDQIPDIKPYLLLDLQLSEDIYLSRKTMVSYANNAFRPMPGMVKEVLQRGRFFVERQNIRKLIYQPVTVPDQERLFPKFQEMISTRRGNRSTYNFLYKRIMPYLRYQETQK